MVIEEKEPAARPAGVPQDQIDNIMSGISNTGSVRMNNHRKKLRQRFDIIKKLGQGTYGKVQLGINKETGQEVAIKTIKKCKIEAEADLIRIRREVQIMSSVQHPNIIHIYEVFENREKMVLVMEFAAGGELYDYLSERKVLTEDEARRIFRQVSTAVYYCHKHKICHRDLKLENILLDEHGNAKIADFGLSNVFDDQRLLATFCGSPLYASPEIVKGTPYQGPEVDCWSLGVLLYTLVYGAMPFDGSNFKRLVKQISQGDYYEPKKPSPASPLIREMLTVCPQSRATIEQICNHWWVNEGYKESCLNLAEDLANQTPVRLDVLLSLSPASITADQLVVPSADENKNTERVSRSHSVGSIREIGNTEAERRILDMVAAGGEAALMPSPTRTITPAESPVQPKRKLENTVSTENAAGAKKKERPTDTLESDTGMDVDPVPSKGFRNSSKTKIDSLNNLEQLEDMCSELLKDPATSDITENSLPRQRTLTKLDAVKETDEIPHESSPTKVVKKFVNKHKTADLMSAINKTSPEKSDIQSDLQNVKERKNSLPEESLTKATERRFKYLDNSEKAQAMSNVKNEKPKKFVITGISVNNFKKEADAAEKLKQKENILETSKGRASSNKIVPTNKTHSFGELEQSDSKSSLGNFSLEEARKSMENSIALLNQARDESSKEVDQLCAKTENVAVSDKKVNHEQKLKNAREIIGNAIQPGGRLCLGVRKPPVPFGVNGRSISGSIVPPMDTDRRAVRVQVCPEVPTTPEETASPIRNTSMKAKRTELENSPPPPTTKTSRAEITLKSATLPRRKPAKSEFTLEIKPKIVEQPMRFSTEMQHHLPDLRSAPIRERPSAYSPLSASIHQRATSLEPQTRERVIPIQKPPTYTRVSSNSIRSGSLSRQSTNESDTDTTTTGAQSQSTITSSSQPIKKSPREFIIPIAVEGGGYVTPRAGSLEPSDSSHTTSSTAFSRLGRPRRISSLLTEGDSEDDASFTKMHTTVTRDGDGEEPKFAMHRLRSTRPVKKLSQDANDSQSSGEDDDEDGFEILTAENLFSTLLQRVRALTNRLNVNNDFTSDFPSSRFLGNIRQTHQPFWQQEPFGRLNNNSGGAWRTNLSRDLGTDIDSIFSRTGATLPRGEYNRLKSKFL